MQRAPLPDELRARLDAETVRSIVEYLAARTGCDQGHWKLDLNLRDGILCRTFVRHGPMGVDALEELGARHASALRG